ncbi:MAG TPA: hypothetical protein VGE65_03110 [Sphingobium sp.]
MEEAEKKIKSLVTIPNLVNWVRHNKRRLDDTIFQLREFAAHPPRHSLQQVQKACADLAYGKTNLTEALEKAENLKPAIVRASAKEVIPTFHKYLKESEIEGLVEFDKFRPMYIIGKKPNNDPLLVPIKPTYVGVRREKLVPVFVIPWVDFKLDQFQKLLLSTIICDAILTQQDFLDSDAEIVALPRIKHTKVRDFRRWRATQYNLLSQEDLAEQFDRYSRALRIVITELEGGD